MKLINIKISSLAIILVLLFGCLSNNNNNYLTLEKFTIQHNWVNNLDSIKWIALIDERGCSGCNITFSTIMSKSINKDEGLILVSSVGRVVDISPYISDSARNVFDADILDFVKLNILKNSGIIFLENNKIDTVIVIESNELKNQIEYINDRLLKP